MTTMEGTLGVARPDVDEDARWRSASLRAARAEATPRRPGWTRTAVVAGAGGIVIGLGWRMLRLLAPGVAELPAVSAAATTVLMVLGTSLLVLSVWANARLGQGSVLRPLSRPDRRALRRELTGRAPLDPEHLPVLSGYARHQRMTFVAMSAFAGFWSLWAAAWRIESPPDLSTIGGTAYQLLVIVLPLAAGVAVLRQRPLPPRWG